MAQCKNIIRLLAEDRRVREQELSKTPHAAPPAIYTSAPKEDLPQHDWADEYPTLRTHKDIVRGPLVLTGEEGVRRLRRQFPALALPEAKEFLVAGGAAMWALHAAPAYSPHDVDLFVAGADSDYATAAVEEFIGAINFTHFKACVSTMLEAWLATLRKNLSKCAAETKADTAAAAALQAALAKITKLQQEVDAVEYCPSLVTPDSFIVRYLSRVVVPMIGGYRKSHEMSPGLWDELGLERPTSLAKRHFAGLSVPAIEVTRTRNAISIVIAETERIQIILRLYEHAADVVWGFDVGSSAVALDLRAARFILSPMGELAARAGCNVVDVARLSPTYASRLKKYVARGFNVVLPHFDIAQVPRENLDGGLHQMVVMPGLRLRVRTAFNNTIVGSVVANTYCYGPEDLDEEYGAYAVRLVAVLQNVRMLVDEGDNYIHVSDCGGRDIANCLPALTNNDITRHIEALGQTIYSGGRLGIADYQRFIDLPLEMFEALTEEARRAAISEALRALERALVDRWRKICDTPEARTLSWMAEHPCSQEKNYIFTGSVKPVYQTGAEYYGRYFRGPQA